MYLFFGFSSVCAGHSLGLERLPVVLPARLLVQLQLPQHTAGLVGRINQESQHLHKDTQERGTTREMENRAKSIKEIKEGMFKGTAKSTVREGQRM